MNILHNTYKIIALISIALGFIVLLNFKKIKKEDSTIIYLILIHSFFEIFIWLLPNVRESKIIGSLTYELLYPIFIISVVILKKYQKIILLSILTISILSQFFIKTSKQIPLNGEFKIVLSFIACLILIYNVYKNLKKIRFQTYMMLLISCIPLFDMFFSIAYFKIISFEMNTWKIFINSYIVFLSITCCIFIYYSGKQLLKNLSPTI